MTDKRIEQGFANMNDRKREAGNKGNEMKDTGAKAMEKGAEDVSKAADKLRGHKQ